MRIRAPRPDRPQGSRSTRAPTFTDNNLQPACRLGHPTSALRNLGRLCAFCGAVGRARDANGNERRDQAEYTVVRSVNPEVQIAMKGRDQALHGQRRACILWRRRPGL